MSALALLLVAPSTVAIHVDVSVGLSDVDRQSVTATLAEAIERRTGTRPTIDPVVGGDCTQDRCRGEIGRRTGSDDIVYLSLLGVPTRIRMTTERVRDDRGDLLRGQRDLPRDPTTWPPAMDAMATMLFPEAVPPPVNAAIVAESTPAFTNPGPWIMIGAAGSTLVGAVIAGLLSAGARNELETKATDIARRDDLNGTVFAGAWTANVLYGVTALTAASGVLWLVFD